MNDSGMWQAVLIVSEIKSRISMAQKDNEMRKFIKEFVMEHKDDTDMMSRFIFIIRNDCPKYSNYLDKILILL